MRDLISEFGRPSTKPRAGSVEENGHVRGDALEKTYAPSSRRNFLIGVRRGAGALIIGCAFGEGAEAKGQRMGTSRIGPKASPIPDAFNPHRAGRQRDSAD